MLPGEQGLPEEIFSYHSKIVNRVFPACGVNELTRKGWRPRILRSSRGRLVLQVLQAQGLSGGSIRIHGPHRMFLWLEKLRLKSTGLTGV